MCVGSYSELVRTLNLLMLVYLKAGNTLVLPNNFNFNTFWKQDMSDSSTEISTNVVTEANCASIIGEINKRFWDIPFENSSFQTENFVISASLTPARAHRTIGLQLSSKLRDLLNVSFDAQREEIDIEELQEKIDNADTNKFERRRAEIDIQQKLSSRSFNVKLVNDAFVECNVLYAHMLKFPVFTREEFEADEANHFTQRLNRAVAGIQGASECLLNMNTDTPSLLHYENETLLLQQIEATK
jgi:hypothetical protein